MLCILRQFSSSLFSVLFFFFNSFFFRFCQHHLESELKRVQDRSDLTRAQMSEQQVVAEQLHESALAQSEAIVSALADEAGRAQANFKAANAEKTLLEKRVKELEEDLAKTLSSHVGELFAREFHRLIPCMFFLFLFCDCDDTL
jgi:hypothetical protein